MANPRGRIGLLARLARLPGNRFGLLECLLGYIAGFIVTEVAVVIYEEASHRQKVVGYALSVTGLIGLWTGFAAAAFLAVRLSGPRDRGLLATFRSAYGVAIRPLVDVPLGIASGLFAQYLLGFVVELPLRPFVPHLYTRLDQPARSITAGVFGPGLVILAVLVCVGSPLFEELFFRGLLLRGLVGAARSRMHLGAVSSVLFAVLTSSVLFGLAHYEALQLPALIGAGATFALLAASTGRLGPGFIAHVTFNTATIITLVFSH